MWSQRPSACLLTPLAPEHGQAARRRERNFSWHWGIGRHSYADDLAVLFRLPPFHTGTCKGCVAEKASLYTEHSTGIKGVCYHTRLWDIFLIYYFLLTPKQPPTEQTSSILLHSDVQRKPKPNNIGQRKLQCHGQVIGWGQRDRKTWNYGERIEQIVLKVQNTGPGVGVVAMPTFKPQRSEQIVETVSGHKGIQ